MKVRGSPGAILLIAIGAVFLSLGWTGRYQAVFEALRTGRSDTASTPEQPGSASGDRDPVTDPAGEKVYKPDANNPLCRNGYWNVLLDNGERMCVLSGDASVAQWAVNNACPSGWLRGTVPAEAGSSQMRTLCFNPRPVNTVQTLLSAYQSQAGQVEDDTAIYPLPTGAFATRYQPNAHHVVEA